MAVPTITCWVWAGARRTSAQSNSLLSIAGLLRNHGSSPLSDGSPCSRVCSVHRSLCGMRIDGGSFHLERQPYIERALR